MDPDNALFVLFLAFEGLSVWGSLEDLSGKLGNAIWKEFVDSLGDGRMKLDELLSKYESAKNRVASVRSYESLAAWSRCAVPVSVAVLFLLCLLRKTWPSTCGTLCVAWTTTAIALQIALLVWLANKKAKLKKWNPENTFRVDLPLWNGAENSIQRL